MTATIKDVARAAGVSVASVSRALNGHESVTESTRKRILDAADELRYVPHPAARSLITRRTQTVGVVLPDLHGEFFSELIRGIDAAARARGLHLLVSSSHGSSAEASETLRALHGRVDGLVVMAPYADIHDVLAVSVPDALPTVFINTAAASDTAITLSIDNEGGATAMIDYLVSLGYRRIAFIGGPAGNFDAEARLAGCRDALAAHGLARDATFLDGDFSEESGHAAGLRIAAAQPRPDAVFAANDMMALGCLSALHESGLRVPEDVALAGFDDIPVARFVSPPLTTVRVAIAELGRSALECLAAQLETPARVGAPPPLECDIVVRSSCGPMRPVRAIA